MPTAAEMPVAAYGAKGVVPAAASGAPLSPPGHGGAVTPAAEGVTGHAECDRRHSPPGQGGAAQPAVDGATGHAAPGHGGAVPPAAEGAVLVERVRGPRHVRAEAWGPFQLARVYARGTPLGWGATCGRHLNAGGDAACCKKQVAHGAEHFSDGDCRRKLKRWLLMGLDIPEEGEDCRTQHLNCARLRALDPRGTEDDLDRELRARLP